MQNIRLISVKAYYFTDVNPRLGRGVESRCNAKGKESYTRHSLDGLPRLNETPRHLPDLTQYMSLPIIDRIKPKDHEYDHQCYAES